jgi:hypothetical protein
MAEDGQQNPDLAAILATLASLQKPESQPYPDQQAHEQSHGYQGYQQHQQQPEQSHHYQQSPDPRLVGRPAPQHRQPHPRPQDRVSSPLIDPSTIIEWKQGLRCVSKIAAQNPDFAPAVRKVRHLYYLLSVIEAYRLYQLMKDQEANVKSWEAGRKKLIEEQKFQRENERTHRAALYASFQSLFHTITD